MPAQLQFGPNQLYSEDLVDAFGRARVSNPVSVGNGFFQYGINPLEFVIFTSGGGQVFKTPSESSVTLEVTGVPSGSPAAGDIALVQSRVYFRYQPGKSQLVMMTGVLGLPTPSATQEIGYYDNNDGVFFRQTETGLNVVIRSSTSGSPVDTVIPQANWNADKMDGTGPSAIVLDFSKFQLFVIDLEWLGTGRIRFGFNILGRMYFCHEQLEAGSQVSPWANTACLPCRWRLESPNTIVPPASMKAGCCSASSEGGFEVVPGQHFAASNGVNRIPVSNRRPVLSIEMAPSFNGVINRAQVLKDNMWVQSDEAIVWELVLNGVLTGAAFVQANPNSLINYDVSATAISGGSVLMSGYCVPTKSSSGVLGNFAIQQLLTALPPLSNSYDGTQGDRLSIVATSFAGTANTAAAINWNEVR